MAAEVDSTTRDRHSAQASIEEYRVRSYDWETKQVLKKLLNASTKVIKFERMLKDTVDAAKPDRIPKGAPKRGGRRKPVYEPVQTDSPGSCRDSSVWLHLASVYHLSLNGQDSRVLATIARLRDCAFRPRGPKN